MDLVRENFIREDEINKFKKTYQKQINREANFNTGKFWDEKFSTIESSLSSQDGMTKDRVRTAYNFIPKGAKRILDIGAGLGFIEELLSKNPHASITGIDVSSNAIKSLKGRFKGNFKQASLYSISFPVSSFDVILALEVLEHIPASKIFSILRKINKFIKRGGYFILSVPMNEGLEKMKDNPNGHSRAYTENIITTELQISGFKVIDLKKFIAFKDFYFVKSRILSRVLKDRWMPNNIVIKAQKI